MKTAMSPNGTQRKVTLYPSRKIIEVAPGVKMAPLAQEHVPEIALVRWQAVGDGTYRPIVKVYDPEIRVMEAAKVLNVHHRILLRLGRAGFVKISQPSPGFYKLNLVSWFDHIETVSADPEFWSREKNRRRYREAL